MPNLLLRPHAPDTDGCVLEVTPQSAGWQRVGFRVHHLSPGQVASGGEAGREACLVVLKGTADIVVESHRFEGLGGRSSVFEDAAPGAVYAPAGAKFRAVVSSSLARPGSCGRYISTARWRMLRLRRGRMPAVQRRERKVSW